MHTDVQTFALGEANRALRLLKEGKIQGRGVLAIPAYISFLELLAGSQINGLA
jgi:hypothetical protein